MGGLGAEGFGKCFIAGEAEFDVTAAFRDVGGVEEVVPKTERETKVNPMGMVGGEVPGVVPDVHLRVVEEIFEGAEG